jgi:hypothetical protein
MNEHRELWYESSAVELGKEVRLNDVIGLYHASHSWTGRFPRASAAPRPPRLATFLARESGTCVLSDAGQEGAVPLLESLIWPRGL